MTANFHHFLLPVYIHECQQIIETIVQKVYIQMFSKRPSSSQDLQQTRQPQQQNPGQKEKLFCK